MLLELSKTRQIKGEAPRRWFVGSDMDLIVWFRRGFFGRLREIIGFQLCYDKNHGEKSLNWDVEHGFAHTGVDDGEAGAMRYKSSPILTPDGTPDVKKIAREFRSRAMSIDPEVFAFVLEALRRYHASNGKKKGRRS
jgi:hypothetical protein